MKKIGQFLCLAFAQLTYRESLRDIVACLRTMKHRLYHMGIRSNVSRNNLAHANETRDWRIFADFAQVLIAEARRLYQDEEAGKGVNNGYDNEGHRGGKTPDHPYGKGNPCTDTDKGHV